MFSHCFFRENRRETHTEKHRCEHQLVVSHTHPQGGGWNLQSASNPGSFCPWADTLSMQLNRLWPTPILISNEEKSHNWWSQLSLIVKEWLILQSTVKSSERKNVLWTIWDIYFFCACGSFKVISFQNQYLLMETTKNLSQNFEIHWNKV